MSGFEANYIITNPYTLSHFNGTHKPVTSVIPHRLVMISTIHCDYCGPLTGENTSAYLLPYNHMDGINSCVKCSGYAKKDIYDYCVTKGIYPMSEEFINNNFPEKVKVLRSNGNIEDWEFEKNVCTMNIKKLSSGKTGLCVEVFVMEDQKRVCKYVYLEDLCNMNKIDYQTTFENIKKQLDIWYAKITSN